MHQTITTIRGFTVNIEIVEIRHEHPTDGLICYIASIYVQQHGSDKKRLVRKSRLPGAAKELHREIQRDGIRAFDRITRRNEATC
jgi:hypothetical protein